MLDKSKTDSELGQKVQNHLKKLGIHTPYNSSITTKEKKDKIKVLFEEILNILGMDLTDDSLKETPSRVSKMYVDEIFWGLEPENFPKCTVIENKMLYDEFVIEKNISVNSTCEHHLLPIIGECYIAYKPNKKVIGLSKLNRIVEYFSKRPQVQERVTCQIAETLKFILETSDVAVVIKGSHTCVSTRGVEDLNSQTITSFMSGCFREVPASRKEFLDLIRI